MSARGSLVSRFVLLATALLFFCLLGYVGLGWALWSDQPWLRKMIGSQRMNHWHAAYACTAGVLLPQDRDGDGVCDGIELFLHTDPQRASDHPPIYLIFEHGDFQVLSLNEISDLGTSLARKEEMVQPGARIPIQCALYVAPFPRDRHPPFPRNFQLRLNAPPFASLALPGAAPAPGPLTIPVSRDGRIAFDLQVSSEFVPGASNTGVVIFANAATNEVLCQRNIRRIWAEPPLTLKAEVIQPTGKQLTFARAVGIDPQHARFEQLNWPAIATTEQYTLVEVARDEEGARWFQLYLHSRAVTLCVVAEDLSTNSFHTYTGPFKFRVVPLRFSPP